MIFDDGDHHQYQRWIELLYKFGLTPRPKRDEVRQEINVNRQLSIGLRLDYSGVLMVVV